MTAQTPPSDPAVPQIDPMMLDLFRVELETQVQVLNGGLLEIERQGERYKDFEPLMRAAHSIKGAGRIVRMEPLISLAHCIEDAFVAAQKGQLIFSQELVDVMLHAVDLLTKLSKVPQSTMHVWLNQQKDEWEATCKSIQCGIKGEPIPPIAKPETPAAPSSAQVYLQEKGAEARQSITEDRVLRVTAQNLNRLMGLAGEALVESHWLQPFADSLLNMKKLLAKLNGLLNDLAAAQDQHQPKEKQAYLLAEAKRAADEEEQQISQRLNDLEHFIIRNSQLSTRLYGEVIDSRMRPFGDCLEGFPRMVRDLAKRLNKKVRLEILGRNTPVDRDILDKLEAPLGHLLRNAVDHGIEMPEERIALGKDPEGKIILEAQHRAGMLLITMSDDGRGIDLEKLRKSIVERRLIKEDVAQKLSESELLDFLMLPGFSTAKVVTDISGRGVGLNVVQNMVQEVAGTLRIINTEGKGTTFNLQLPLTLSVIRALIVEVSGDPYAFPLARIDHVLDIHRENIKMIEGKQFFVFEEQNIGLIQASQVLELPDSTLSSEELPVVIFSDRHNAYGVAVDKLVGQREFVVHELDPRLKKIPDVSSAALMEDGAPIIILDVEDMVRSIDRMLTVGHLQKLHYGEEKTPAKHKKRILVVDDSITVREVEARLLRNHGYEVEMAVNGMDGWNAVRVGKYDLVVTDVDMPRMNGIELVRAIRADSRLKDLPVMIVSYKEREEDRLLGLEAGASYYLTKSSFHDETLLDAVIDLIGK